MALYSEGWLFLLRWIHFLAGITWIGLLYYFNFVQTPFFAETEAPVRAAPAEAPARGRSGGSAGARCSRSSPAGSTSSTAGSGSGSRELGRPGRSSSAASSARHVGQRLVRHLAQPARSSSRTRSTPRRDSPANPAAAAAGARAGLASRTNTCCRSRCSSSWARRATSALRHTAQSGLVFWIVALVIMAAGRDQRAQGTPGKGAAKPLATVKGTLWAGFILTVVYYIWFEGMR